MLGGCVTSLYTHITCKYHILIPYKDTWIVVDFALVLKDFVVTDFIEET